MSQMDMEELVDTENIHLVEVDLVVYNIIETISEDCNILSVKMI